MSQPTPTREELRETYRSLERRASLWVKGEALVAFFSLLVLQTEPFLTAPLEGGIVFGLSFFPSLLAYLYLLTEKKKKVQDIRGDIQLGSLRKQDLLDVVQVVFSKMGLPPDAATVYLTGDKIPNASAVSLSLGVLSKRFRFVLLNRAIVHLSDKEELQTVLAHELAHIFRYPQALHKFALLRSFAVAILATVTWSNAPSLIMIAIGGGLYLSLVSRILGDSSQAVEYLCDDCGAQIGGVEPALRMEFKIAHHKTIVTSAYRKALELKLGGVQVSGRRLMELVEESLPYGPSAVEVIEREVTAKLLRRQKESQQSFGGFFLSLLMSDSYDNKLELEDELERIRESAKGDTISLPKGEYLSLPWFRELVNTILAEPSKPLFALPEEMNDQGTTHPAPRKRILYLWKAFVERD